MQQAMVGRRALIDAAWPTSGAAREIALLVGGSLLIALSAQVRIPLPFSPVPITAQTLAVLFLGALYGSRRAPVSVLFYLGLGLLGFPVFASAPAGALALSGPTAGYLLSYVPAAFAVGLLTERGATRSAWSTAASMVLGNAIIYAIGATWLAQFVGWDRVLVTGVLPFLPGDALKIVLATIALPAGWRFLGTRAHV